MRYGLWVVVMVAACSSGPVYRPPTWPPIVENGPLTDDTVDDTFVQALPPQVDVLWAVDSSPLMGPLQLTLAIESPRLLNFLLGSGIDWHMGVVSTDLETGSGALQDWAGTRFLSPETPSPDLLLQDLLLVGDGGVEPQEALGAIHAAWFEQAETANAGFYRETAVVHTLVVSNRDDATTSISPAVFVADYATLGSERTFTVLGDPGDSAVFQTVADDLGGAVLDATVADLGPLVAALGVEVGGYAVEFFLTDLPVWQTIEVSVFTESGALIPFVGAVPDPVTGKWVGDWVYDPRRNSVTFLEYIPDALSTVRVTYVPSANPTGEP